MDGGHDLHEASPENSGLQASDSASSCPASHHRMQAGWSATAWECRARRQSGHVETIALFVLNPS